MREPPRLVVHADWSVDARRRWLCRAVLGGDGRYRVFAPEPVGPLDRYFDDLATQAGGGAILAGFDFPIGLPETYARKAGIRNFLKLLPRLGGGPWSDFYEVAALRREIALRRPFYPARPGGTKRDHLVRGLGLGDFSDLMRRCDGATGDRPAANAIFWTLGAKQVGKATIVGWRDTIVPALRAGRHDIAIWPFSGPLRFTPGGIMVVEAYPAEFYGHLGLREGPRWSKRTQVGRSAKAAPILAWVRRAGVTLAQELRNALKAGFSPAADGEDRFDAVVGTLGQLGVVLGQRPPGDPPDSAIQRIEGWILGQVKG